MSTSDIILVGGVFKASDSSQGGSQSTGAGAGKVVTSVAFEVYGVSSATTSGSSSSGAGAGKTQFTDLGSVTVSLKDFGQNSYGFFGFAASTSTPYSSFAIKETSSPTFALLNANSGSVINEPNGTLTLFEYTV